MSEKYHDRFSKAEEESGEKSAFVCESCDKKYSRKTAEEKGKSCCGRTMRELLKESFGP